MDEVRTIELFRHQVPGLHQIAEDVKKFIADMLATPALVHEHFHGKAYLPRLNITQIPLRRRARTQTLAF
jgi:hypothetical protein